MLPATIAAPPAMLAAIVGVKCLAVFCSDGTIVVSCVRSLGVVCVAELTFAVGCGVLASTGESGGLDLIVISVALLSVGRFFRKNHNNNPAIATVDTAKIDHNSNL